MPCNCHCQLGYECLSLKRLYFWSDLHSCSNQHSACFGQAALTRELALIQGPPGTGKTFVGIQLVKALLANTQGNIKGPVSEIGPDQPEPSKQPAPRGPHVGPVLIVCFTNHALDQFLEGLLAAGLTDMVRVGGRWWPSILCCVHSA